MASPVENNTKTNFFPDRKVSNLKGKGAASARNESIRQAALDKATAKDAKVEISDGVKDFSRIKKAVDAAPDIDNSAKIAKLKASIKDGSYKVDYDGLADKIMASEL